MNATMQRTALIVAVLTGAVAATAAAQDTLRLVPGSSDLAIRPLAGAVDTFRLELERDGTRTPVVTLVREIALAAGESGVEGRGSGEHTVLRFSQQHTGADGAVSVDTTWVVASSLAPIRYVAAGRGRQESYEFREDSIVGWREVDGQRTVDGFALDGGVFSAVADELVLRSLPLGEGLVVLYQAFNSARPPASTRVEVVGREAVDASTDTDAWLLHYDAGAAPTRIWIGTTSGRLLRLEADLPGGATFIKSLAGGAS